MNKDAATQEQTSLNIINGETPKEELQEKEVSDEQVVVTQEPVSLNTIDLGEVENPQGKIQEKEASEKEDVVTQEPASLNILAEIATNSGIEKPRDEVIPDFMDEDCTVTPESSHDTKIIEVESQQQGNDGVEQGDVTQEPASLNVLVQVGVQMGGELGIEGTLEFNK